MPANEANLEASDSIPFPVLSDGGVTLIEAFHVASKVESDESAKMKNVGVGQETAQIFAAIAAAKAEAVGNGRSGHLDFRCSVAAMRSRRPRLANNLSFLRHSGRVAVLSAFLFAGGVASGQTPAPANAPSATLNQATPGAVHVHIDSPKPAILYRRPHGETTFARVCDAPCDTLVPLGDDYQISVEGTNTMNLALFGKNGDSVEIAVQPSTGNKSTAIVMVLGGLAAFGGGALLDLFGLGLLGTSTGKTGCNDCHPTGAIVLGVGLVFTVGGAVLGAMGVARLVNSKSGNVDEHVLQPDAATTRTSERDDNLLPAPTWRTRDVLATSSPVITFPIFARAF